MILPLVFCKLGGLCYQCCHANIAMFITLMIHPYIAKQNIRIVWPKTWQNSPTPCRKSRYRMTIPIYDQFYSYFTPNSFSTFLNTELLHITQSFWAYRISKVIKCISVNSETRANCEVHLIFRVPAVVASMISLTECSLVSCDIKRETGRGIKN